MARIKVIPKRNGTGSKRSIFPNIPRKSAIVEPTPTVKPPEPCKIVLEIGASRTSLMQKQPGGGWEYIKLGKGVGASNVSGVDIVPTMTAIRSQGESLDVRHGIHAVNARISDSQSWVVFEYLKHAYINKAPTAEVERILKNQREVASERGCDILDLADQYFYDILGRFAQEGAEPPILFTNINDAWPNEVAQRLIRGFQKTLPGAEIHGVNECLSSLIGAMSREPVTVTHPIHLVYVDCGHSTTELCAVTVNPGELRFVIHDQSWRSENLGAGMIDMAVANELRAINEEAGESDLNKGVWDTLQYFTEYVKPNMDAECAARASLTDLVWRRLMRKAREVDKEFHLQQVDLILQLLRKTCVADADNQLLLTGRASLSVSFLAVLKPALNSEFPDVKLLHKVEERTYVQYGLACMADDLDKLSVDAAPMSLWMRSDPDASEEDNEDIENDEDDEGRARSEEQQEAVRICRQGQTLDPKTVGKFDRNPSHAIHYELCCKLGRPEIDLSVFGTPPSLADEDVIVRKGRSDGKGKSRECLVFSKPAKLTRFGDFREELPMQNDRADGIYHVYVFSRITRIGITLFAVFAEDGHKIPTLEDLSINSVLEGLSLLSDWKSHDGARLDVMRLGQVARPEFLVGSLDGQSMLQSNGGSVSSQKKSVSKPKNHQHRHKRRRKDDELIL